MTTSGHGTKRMLSRGPALLLAPLLLLCRGNPGPAAATPALWFCLFGLVFVFILVFVFNDLCLFYISPPPPVLFKAVSPILALPPPAPPGAPRKAAGGTRSEPRLWGAPRSPHPAPQPPAASPCAPRPHACRGLPAPCAKPARLLRPLPVRYC